MEINEDKKGGFIGKSIRLDLDKHPDLIVLSDEEYEKRKTATVRGNYKIINRSFDFANNKGENND